MIKHIFIGFTYATIFGLTFMFTKIGLNSIHPIGLIAFRFTIASMVLKENVLVYLEYWYYKHFLLLWV